MVNIKGLDKARVLKALYEHSHVQGLGAFQAVHMGVPTLEYFDELLKRRTCFEYIGGRILNVDLYGDEFDEHLYDMECGEGAAQRAVDSIWDEQAGGEDTTGGASGEKKEPFLEEQAEMTKEAVHKIMDILNELPPNCHIVASMTLRMALLGPVSDMTGMLMMGRPLAPSVGGMFGMGVYGPITDDPDLLGRIKRRFG